MKGKIGYGEGCGLIEVHVFHKAICVEEVVTLPARRQMRQCGWGELGIDILSATEDDVVVICSREIPATLRPAASRSRGRDSRPDRYPRGSGPSRFADWS